MRPLAPNRIPLPGTKSKYPVTNVTKYPIHRPAIFPFQMPHPVDLVYSELARCSGISRAALIRYQRISGEFVTQLKRLAFGIFGFIQLYLGWNIAAYHEMHEYSSISRPGAECNTVLYFRFLLLVDSDRAYSVEGTRRCPPLGNTVLFGNSEWVSC